MIMMFVDVVVMEEYTCHDKNGLGGLVTTLEAVLRGGLREALNRGSRFLTSDDALWRNLLALL